ncbi:MerR family transcriptional regulator [Flavobacterium gawalongense]|uniref:MerR family transcriptional regulator n=1 Tax=Flavobacterium gawalongense TaxID=2594432 RepID=A0A553BL56_9FLAO|nr:MerR family transcriptional regulator [Flavobacterium gawalongense]TRX00389.1 MerR family transcriptional regulator [Flavobacterium gawalongense]TRX05064.1 MerR family transcriptional regulator [Flavobacterium gawalongense]TRX08983.1 MerR family transcriptional regulator [Flavobacterium gawalongense]TRX10030.1 MerR family transcriptional regulator [Flavobacterium gawalongense]TRX26937.1 MerR family transcriptional regulator [Flavobacterium gawalongense]
MNNIKSIFSIKDLENLSGIKAHTIRIWEKRYDILQPMRTDTNIRLYDLASLQKLLNITLLHDYGYKISKIATYPQDKIPSLVREIISTKNAKNHAISAFKMAMMNFDQELFFNTYNWLIAEKSFREIFYEVFIPLMNELGLLWQTDTITPAHEHFISYLVKQKLLVNTEKLQVLKQTKFDKVFVLSLPMNEIHELGLMFLNYEILLNGYKTIYLGESMPIENLKDLKKHFNPIVFISYLTVQPERDSINEYVAKMTEELVDDTTELWYIGRLVEFIKREGHSDKISIFDSITELVDRI